MPELPEVEVTRMSLMGLVGQQVRSAIVRRDDLRSEIPPLAEILPDRTLLDISRRGKHLIFQFSTSPTTDYRPALLVHLGMSGHFRLMDSAQPPAAGVHDHIDIVFEDKLLRYHDPRRFGEFDVFYPDIMPHLRLLQLGIEPLGDQLTAEWLRDVLKNRTIPIKQALMLPQIIVGIGNIYASESLFHAGILPTRPSNSLTFEEASRLVTAIQDTLQKAIAAGGSSMKDFINVSGETGYFQLQTAVYGRKNLPCYQCGTLICQIHQSGRSTFFCPNCQH